MQILKSSSPVLLELNPEDIYLLHNALYEFKEWLKHTDKISKAKKREWRQRVGRMITLMDLLL